MNDDVKKNAYNIGTLLFNQFVPYDTKPEIDDMNGWILNGKDNSHFNRYRDLFDYSITNKRVIFQIVSYIIGAGLIEENVTDFNLEKFISKKDVSNIAYDLKEHGSFAIKIFWSKGSVLNDIKPMPAHIKWVDVMKVGLHENNYYEIDGCFVSRDWCDTVNFPPRFYTKFDGIYKEDKDVEMLFVNLDSRAEYFSKPDYFAALKYCDTEKLLSNAFCNHINNGFSAGRIINFNNGTPTEEEKIQIINDIEKKFHGVENTNSTVYSFNESKENEITVYTLETRDLDAVMTFLAEESEKKILLSHGIVNPILFGDRNGGGLGSNTDEMNEALKHLQINKIFHFRNVIIDALESVIKVAEPNAKLAFDNFKDEIKDENTEKNNDVE